MDSNPSIEPQLHSLLFIIPLGFRRLNTHNAFISALQISLFVCQDDVLQFHMSIPTLIINSKLQWTLQGDGDGNHEHK
jgi:hypothetical protein